MSKHSRISFYTREIFHLTYDFAPDPIQIASCIRNIFPIIFTFTKYFIYKRSRSYVFCFVYDSIFSQHFILVVKAVLILRLSILVLQKL